MHIINETRFSTEIFVRMFEIARSRAEAPDDVLVHIKRSKNIWKGFCWDKRYYTPFREKIKFSNLIEMFIPKHIVPMQDFNSESMYEICRWFFGCCVHEMKHAADDNTSLKIRHKWNKIKIENFEYRGQNRHSEFRAEFTERSALAALKRGELPEAEMLIVWMATEMCMGKNK